MDAQEIIDEVAEQLTDVGHVTWTEVSLRRYITTAQEMIVKYRPDAYMALVAVQLAAGSKQDLPTAGLRLIDIKRNMGTDGNTPGRPCNSVEEDALDLFQLVEESSSPVVKDYSYDDRIPDVFYVYPPNDGTGWVEMAYSQIPPRINANNQELVVKDIYRNAVIQWCMFRAYSIEVDSASSQKRAQEHEASFYQMMGVKLRRDVQYSPSVEVQAVTSAVGETNGG